MNRPELDHYCRDCHHMTSSIGVGQCQWCHSGNIGRGSAPLKERRAPSRPQEQIHDVARQMAYPSAYRMSRGFAILNGGDI